MRLSATKTGKSVRPIGAPALKLLASLPKTSDIWVFPVDGPKTDDAADQPAESSIGNAEIGKADLKKRIASLFNLAGLHDSTSHDLRPTFASAAADEGYSDATIAALLGHSQRNVTARHYIRRPDEALVAAANRTANRLLADLDGYSAQVIPLNPAQSGVVG